MMVKPVGMEVESMKIAIMFYGHEICSYVTKETIANGGISTQRKHMLTFG